MDVTPQQGIVKPMFPRVLFVPQCVSVTTAPHCGGWIFPGDGICGVGFIGWGGTTTLLDEGAPSITCSHPRCSWSSSALPFWCVPLAVPGVSRWLCPVSPWLCPAPSAAAEAERDSGCRNVPGAAPGSCLWSPCPSPAGTLGLVRAELLN